MSLIWLLTKNHSSFLVHQGNEQFTKDPFSSTGKNNKSDSGLTEEPSVNASYSLKDGKKNKKGKVEKYSIVLKHAKKYKAKVDPKSHKDGRTNTLCQLYSTVSVKSAANTMKALVCPAVAKKALKKLAILHHAAQIQKKYKPIKKEKKAN